MKIIASTSLLFFLIALTTPVLAGDEGENQRQRISSGSK